MLLLFLFLLPLNLIKFVLDEIFWLFFFDLVGVAYKVKVLLLGLTCWLVFPRFSLIVVVKIGVIGVVGQLWNEGRSHLLDAFPVDILEPGVRLDLVGPLLTQSFRVCREQSADEIDCLERNVYFGWEVKILLKVLDFVVDLVIVVSREGSVADDHFVDDDSQRPPVHQFCVALFPQHLRGNVVGCAHCTEGQSSFTPRLAPRKVLFEGRQHSLNVPLGWLVLMGGLGDLGLRLVSLAQSEVAQPDVSLGVDEHVVGLEVSVDVVLGVNTLDRQSLHKKCDTS